MQPMRAIIASVPGPILSDTTKKILEKLRPMGITIFKRNIINFKQLKKLIKDIKEVLGPDVLIAIDQEGGRVCRLTPPDWPEYTPARSWGMIEEKIAEKALYLQTLLMADDLKQLGINLDYTPVLDIRHKDTSLALTSRCFSEKAKQVTSLGKIVLQTFQDNGILACIKHLPGHGQASVDPHLHLPIITEPLKNLEDDFYPFKMLSPLALIGMTAHIVIPELDTAPITLSEKGIRLLIREHIGFKGFLLSDGLDMKALKGTIPQKALGALKAGCDAVCYCFGEDDVLEELAKTLPFLTEDAQARWQKFKPCLERHMEHFDRTKTLSDYRRLQQKAPVIPEEYDVVETLHQMKKG